MKATPAWPQLLRAIEKHGKNVRQLLMVHTSTCGQPQKAEALVPSLEAAGLGQAHLTGSGAWTVSLDMPALYAPGDGAAFHITVEGPSKQAVVQDLRRLLLLPFDIAYTYIYIYIIDIEKEKETYNCYYHTGYNEEACQICLAFLLVVAPRKIVLHMNSLAQGVASKNALIVAGLAVQAEMGPPHPGTHRHRFLGDETPRIDLGNNPPPKAPGSLFRP